MNKLLVSMWYGANVVHKPALLKENLVLLVSGSETTIPTCFHLIFLGL